MGDLVQAFFALIGGLFVLGCAAAIVTFAVSLVCKWMEWTPFTLSVTFNDHRTQD